MCYYDRSPDGGLTFSQDAVIHDNLDAVSHSLARIAEDCQIRVYVTWMDKRNGINKFDIFFARSADILETVSTPNTPSGPASGLVGTNYTYSTGGSTSSLGHDVQYIFYWGDGTDSGWLSVGTTSAQKSWSSASTYNVTAKARCAKHTTVESSASSALSVAISVAGYDNSPSNYQVIPECIWASATGGGTWMSEVQITDITGGSVVSVYFDYGAGNRRGPFTLSTSPGPTRM